MAFNEAESLVAVISEIQEALEALERPFEILVVNDGSTDETGSLGDSLAEEHAAVRVVHHRENQGLGEVYRT